MRPAQAQTDMYFGDEVRKTPAAHSFAQFPAMEDMGPILAGFAALPAAY